MAIYHDTEVFCPSITGTNYFQHCPLRAMHIRSTRGQSTGKNSLQL